MPDIAFDSLTNYTITGKDFKSWNNDPNFKYNAQYFKFTKPYKVQVEFWGDTDKVFGIIDILLWPNSYFEIKPTQFTIEYSSDSQSPAIFQFYVTPFFQGKEEGRFEPRVYDTGNISRVVVTKLLELKDDESSKYTLFLVRRAKDMLELAGEKMDGQVFGLSLHFSRFCIELSLKSIFPMFQQKIPYVHDVSDQVSEKLRNRIKKQSPDFGRVLPRLLWISQLHISPDRLDFYGDPLSQAPPDLFVTKNEAKIALENAEFCYKKCCELFENVMKKS